MRNFQQIARADVVPLLAAIHRQPELWNANRLRKDYPGSPHSAMDDIWIRFNELGAGPGSVIDATEAVWYPAADRLPQVRPILFDLMRRVEGERLGRVVITRLAPGGRIEPHCDQGAPAEYYQRYHVSLACEPGCNFRSGDETVFMQPGTVWWFDNCKEHEVLNYSSDDRMTMIVDIRQS